LNLLLEVGILKFMMKKLMKVFKLKV
jgi:hypothetical protein